MSKKILKGTVVSNKMDKTVVVSVNRFFRHPRYPKLVRKTKNFKARTEVELEVGQEVKIEECRPLSKTVCWKVQTADEKKNKK